MPCHRSAFVLHARHLVEVAEDLAGNVFSARLLVVHDASRGGEDNVAERTSGKHVGHPALNLVQGDAEARRHNTALVDAAVELHDDLAGAVVVNDVEVANVA